MFLLNTVKYELYNYLLLGNASIESMPKNEIGKVNVAYDGEGFSSEAGNNAYDTLLLIVQLSLFIMMVIAIIKMVENSSNAEARNKYIVAMIVIGICIYLATDPAMLGKAITSIFS